MHGAATVSPTSLQRANADDIDRILELMHRAHPGETVPSRDDVATLVWSLNSPDYFQLLRGRGLTATQYADVVADVWTRTLLS